MSTEFWNARYATDEYVFGTAPNRLLKYPTPMRGTLL